MCWVLTIGLPLRARAQALRGTFAAGSDFALSIHADGTLWATGANDVGQLGVGSTINQARWVQVGSADDWVQVAAGDDHALGLRSNGTVYTWGYNASGQLGNGNVANSSSPVALAGTYTQVAAGSQHSLALQANGTLYAWGSNGNGQLGNSDISPHSTPVAVSGSNYTQVCAGGDYTLALRANGSAYAWGANGQGQLGDGTTTDRSSPTAVGGGGLYTQLVAGSAHVLGLRDDGTLWAWGDNQYGQLGDGTTTDRNVPTAVSGSSYTQLAAGLYHSLALRADGIVYSWGRNNSGQLGSGGTTDRSSPAAVSGLAACVQLAAAERHSLALQANGQLAGWGNNASGQLGTGTPALSVAAPTITGTALPTRSTAMGGNFSLAVRANGTLLAWGDNSAGQLARSPASLAYSTLPLQIGSDNDWVMVAAGTSFALALKADGRLYAWGANRYGQLGASTNNGTNTPVTTLTLVGSGYTRVAAGFQHSLGLLADGSLLAWGYNFYGQLANPDPASQGLAPNPTPRLVSTDRYTSMAGGTFFSLSLRADGKAYGWGVNDRGQLGTSTNAGSGIANTTPLPVNGTLYTALAAGGSHSLGLRADGTLYAWGNNASGQLGFAANGAANLSPTAVSGKYAQLATGNQHSLGRRADGTLWTWGDNGSSQLARPTGDPATPTPEATAGTGWTTLATGSGANHTLVRTATGLNFASAGQNNSGQLGDGTRTVAPRLDRLSPLTALQPLPVELLGFTARRTDPATVALVWSTSSELNNAGFTVERSADGVAFRAVGFVAGAGSSTHPLRYAYLDAAAPLAAYYRLRQQDYDGRAAYSPVAYVAAVTGATVRLFPNPACGAVTLTGAAPGARVQVLDRLGRPVRTATTDAAGQALLPALPAGLYLVRVPGAEGRMTAQRLLVE